MWRIRTVIFGELEQQLIGEFSLWSSLLPESLSLLEALFRDCCEFRLAFLVHVVWHIFRRHGSHRCFPINGLLFEFRLLENPAAG
jgi:hypothetical protein